MDVKSHVPRYVHTPYLVVTAPNVITTIIYIYVCVSTVCAPGRQSVKASKTAVSHYCSTKQGGRGYDFTELD